MSLIWSKKNKGPVIIQMETNKGNMFGVRTHLKSESLRTKIERRSLQRMGHVLRMSNDRLTKRYAWAGTEGGREGEQESRPPYIAGER